MRHETRLMNMPATGANGTATRCEDLADPAVAIDFTGAGASTLAVQAKISGPDTAANEGWFAIKTGINASSIVPIADPVSGAPIPATHVRIVSTTTGAPAPKAVVGGHNSRTE